MTVLSINTPTRMNNSKSNNKIFLSEDNCLKFLFKSRWRDGFVCPSCKSKEAWFIDTRQIYECKGCSYQITPTAGTIFHKTHLPLTLWFRSIKLVLNDNYSATELKAALNIKSYPTAWAIVNRIKEAHGNERELLEEIAGIKKVAPLDGKIDLSFKDNIASFIASKRDGSFDSKSITAYASNLEKFRQYIIKNNLNLFHLAEKNINDYLKYLKEKGFNNSTINQHISALRGLFQFLEKTDKIDNPIINTKFRSITSDKKEQNPAIEKILEALHESNAIPIKEKLIFYLMASFEINGARICELRLSDISIDDEKIVLASCQKIIIAEKDRYIFTLFKNYYDERIKTKGEFVNFFITSNNKPLLRPNIIFYINKICEILGYESLSLLDLSHYSLLAKRKNLLKKYEIFNKRYKIIYLKEKDENATYYRVVDKDDNNKPYILKIYSSNYLGERFKDIEKIINALLSANSPFIIRVKETGYLETNDGFYIVDESIVGIPLAKIAGHLKSRDTKDICRDIITSLSLIREYGVIIKNIHEDDIVFLKEKDRIHVKFKTGRIIEELHNNNLVFINKALNSEATERDAIESLGKFLYLLISGKDPDKTRASQNETPTNLYEITPKCSLDLSRIIMRMFGKHNDAFKNYREVLDAINLLFFKEINPLKKVNLLPPIDEAVIRTLANAFSTMREKSIREYPVIIEITDMDNCENELLFGEIENLSKKYSVKSIYFDASEDECAYGFYSHISGRNLSDLITNVSFNTILKSYYDIDYLREKYSVFDKCARIIKDSAPIALIINGITEGKGDLIELFSYIARSAKKEQIALTIICTNNQELPTNIFLDNKIFAKSEKYEIKPLTGEAIKHYLAESFNLEIKNNLIDYIESKSRGCGTMVYRLIKEMAENGEMIIGKSGKLEFNEEKETKILDEYKTIEGIFKEIITILALIKEPTEFDLLFSIQRKASIKVDIEELKSALQILNDRKMIKTLIWGESKKITLPPSFDRKDYIKKLAAELDKKYNRYIADVFIDKGIDTFKKLRRVIYHIKSSSDFERLATILLSISEELRINGFLSDSLRFIKEAEDYSIYFSTEKKFYRTLMHARTLFDLTRFDEAVSKLNRSKDFVATENERLLFLTYKTRFLLKKGELKNLRELFDEAILASKKLKENELEYHLVMLKGSALILLSRFEGAFSLVNEYLTQKLIERYPEKKINLLILSALINYYQSNFTESISILGKLVEFIPKISNKQIVSKIYHMLGMIYYRQLDFTNALNTYKKGLKELSRSSDLIGKALLLQNLAIVYQRRGNFFRALALYNESLQIFVNLGKPVQHEEIVLGMALLYYNLSDLPSSAKYLNEALALSQSRENNRLLGYCHSLLGDINKREGEFDESSKCYELAQNLLKKNDIKKEYLLTTINKIDLFVLTGRFDLANSEIDSINNDADIFSDVSIRMLLLKLKLLTFQNKLSSCEDLFKKIIENPLYNKDWEVTLDYHFLRACYLKMMDKIAEAEREKKFLVNKMVEFSNGLTGDLINSFILKSEYGRIDYVLLSKIKKEERITEILKINSELTSIEDEDIFYESLIKNSIRLMDVKNVTIIRVGEGKKPKILLRKNEKGINLKRDLSSELLEFLKRAKDGANNKNIMAFNIAVENRIELILLFEFLAVSCFPDDELLTLFRLLTTHAGLVLSNINKKRALEEKLYNIEKDRNNLIREKEIKETDGQRFKEELMVAENRLLIEERRSKFIYDNIIGSSQKIRDLLEYIEKIAASDAAVLITGESGTGKELVARALHQKSKRSKNLFFAENCAAFSETLLESELFGHKAGSFTGALQDRIGIFQMAHNGTVFLDEVGDMTLNMQKKLLRVLEEGEVRRVGDNNIMKVNIRIISATNRDLSRLIKEGKFREDLFYRLRVLSVHIPPLRERKDDIEELVYYFINKHSKKGISIESDVIEMFKRYNWMGNVRELENEVQKLILLSDGKRIGKDLIADDLRFTGQ